MAAESSDDEIARLRHVAIVEELLTDLAAYRMRKYTDKIRR